MTVKTSSPWLKSERRTLCMARRPERATRRPGANPALSLPRSPGHAPPPSVRTFIQVTLVVSCNSRILYTLLWAPNCLEGPLPKGFSSRLEAPDES